MKKLHAPFGVALLALAAAVGITACGDREPAVKTAAVDANGLPANASPSAKLIGVPPAETPSPDTVGTTPAAPGAKTGVEQKEKTYPMPWPGQPNDHSNLAPNASQKAGAVDPQQLPERKSP
jgi:hypothetical protein